MLVREVLETMNRLTNRFRSTAIPGLVVTLLLIAGCVKEMDRPENADTAPLAAAIVSDGTATATPGVQAGPRGSSPALSPASAGPSASGPAPAALTAKATPQPEPALAAGGKAEPNPTATPPPALGASETPQPRVGEEPTPTSAIGGAISTGLFLRMTNVPKESVVHTTPLSLSGITSPDAVVSVNGVLVDVNREGKFTASVALEPAPNLIEIVASDFRANKVTAVLTVIHIP